MIYDKFRAALYLLMDENIISIPYGVVPDIDNDQEISEAFWTDTQWNPPSGLNNEHLTIVDSNASPKPDYETVVTATSRLEPET